MTIVSIFLPVTKWSWVTSESAGAFSIIGFCLIGLAIILAIWGFVKTPNKKKGEIHEIREQLGKYLIAGQDMTVLIFNITSDSPEILASYKADVMEWIVLVGSYIQTNLGMAESALFRGAEMKEGDIYRVVENGNIKKRTILLFLNIHLRKLQELIERLP
jgi:hypothetical protein